MKNTTQATGPATPQQIYLRRAAHSAATYLGYQCQLAQAPEAPVQLLPDGDLPHEALQAPYLRMVFTQPSGMAQGPRPPPIRHRRVGWSLSHLHQGR
jgi:hypothetical protein